jgi:hypothetical protein
LYKLKQILEDFSKISGLKCNFDKTCVIPLNCGADDIALISQVGFKIVDNVTLLGFRLDENGPMTEIIFQDVYRKICNIIAMWDRYKLSLPGRIGIFKSLLLSQVSFHGSILRPSTDTVKRIQAVMNNYVIGNLRVAKDRLYTDPGRGGLGLIDLDQYLVGLHVSWVKKANLSAIDNWRTDLRSVTYGNPLISGSALPGIRNMPILQDLSSDYEKFSKCFYNTEGNFKDAFVLYNKFFSRDGNHVLTSAAFMQNRPALDMAKIGKLVFSDFFQENGPVSLDELCANTGINFNLITYLRIQEFFAPLLNRFSTRYGKKSIAMTDFLGKRKGESKKVRKLLNSVANSVPVSSLRQITTFSRLTGTVADDFSSDQIILWSRNYLPNKIREFAFKFYNNSLAVNTRASHYVQNRQRGCTLCTISGKMPVPDETFQHLFLECDTACKTQTWFAREYNLPVHERKKIFL